MTYSNIKNMRERGFTIVELLIVIIVIGILATLVLISYNNITGQGRDTKRQSDAQTILKAAETFKTTSIAGTYPDLTSGTTFQTQINNAALYSSGTKVVAVDSTVSNNISTTAPSASNPNNITITQCGGTGYSDATGLKATYWSENKKAAQTATTGTGC